MSVTDTVTPFLLTFYILGQSPFPTATLTSKNNFKIFLFKLPALIIVCVSLYVTINFLKNNYYVEWENRGYHIIHGLLIMSSLITNLVIAYQCLFQGPIWIELQESFCWLETEFQELLPNKKVKLTKFRIYFIIKCCAVLVSCFILIIAMIISQRQAANEYFYTSYVIVLAFINNFFAFQVVFYVDLIKYFLKTITHAFQDSNADNEKAKCLKETLIESNFVASMKKLHSSVYKTVGKINEYFGLFLLSYIIQQFLVISYYIFCIFLNKSTFVLVRVWVNNASVLICALLSFFFVSNSCHKTYVETQKIGNFLYDDDYLVLPESRRFLSQITNQPIRITAKEFYKIDRSFFAALTVGGVTSAVMLIQFQNN